MVTHVRESVLPAVLDLRADINRTQAGAQEVVHRVDALALDGAKGILPSEDSLPDVQRPCDDTALTYLPPSLHRWLRHLDPRLTFRSLPPGYTLLSAHRARSYPLDPS